MRSAFRIDAKGNAARLPTIAWLTDKDRPLVNTFDSSKVTCEVQEKFDGKVKSDVNVKNTGDIDAFIRVKLVTYRTNDAGQHIGGTAADVLDLVDFVNLPFIKNNLQGSQSSLGAEAHIDFHIALFSLNHLRCLLCRMKIPDRVNVVVVVGVDAAQNRVCVHDRPLYTAITVALAQGVHGFVDVFQLLALFFIGEKA